MGMEMLAWMHSDPLGNGKDGLNLVDWYKIAQE